MNILIIKLIFVVGILFLLSKYKNILFSKKYSIAIALISCNRFEYLNHSISSIMKHITTYEKKIYITFIHFDQGTPARDYIIQKYNIYNIFFMNPNGYAYSFQLIFSYVYSKYVLLLEEDWNVIDGIEQKIKNKDFLYISMYVLSLTNYIYGLYLRNHTIGLSIKRKDKTSNITYYEVYKPTGGCCYTNGPSIYKTKILKNMQYGKSEIYATRDCLKRKYHIGYILWEYSSLFGGIKYLFNHIGEISTKRGICNISMY